MTGGCGQAAVRYNVPEHPGTCFRKQQNTLPGVKGMGFSMFVSFDGIDGVGKSTQLQLTSSWLEQQGYQVTCCRDPGSTPLGESIREIILNRKQLPVSIRSEMLLYMTARAQLVEEIIKPALDQGRVVLSDRFLLSNVVYQGHAGGLDPAQVWETGLIATGGILPHLSIVFDMELSEAMARLGGEKDRMESRGEEFFKKVQAGFLQEAERDPGSIHIVDAAGSQEDVQQRVQRIFQQQLETSTMVDQAGSDIT